MKILLTLFSILIIPGFLFSQKVQKAKGQRAKNQESGWKNSGNWEDHKHEVFVNIGPSFFLGDVGGLNRVGTTKSPVDLDGKSTRFQIGAGYRYKFHPRFSTTSNLTYAMLYGSDSFTEEEIRRSRNITVRTQLLELTQRIEFIVWAKEDVKTTYNTGQRNMADIFYVYTGITGFLYAPQAQINDKWTNLRPLKTEGQGLPGGAKPYGLFNFGIPVGIGFKYGLPGNWRVGIEVSYTKTFTDYLDDTSTEYYDPNVLLNELGEDAVYAANPAKENHTWFSAGQQRGNKKDKDAYMFLNITLTKNITGLGGDKQKRSKGKYQGKSRTKF